MHLARFRETAGHGPGIETLYLEKHKLDFTDAITYYAFVEDNYPPRPHRVVSELRFIDILPFKQDYQWCEGEAGGSCNGSVSLEELIARQRVNLNRTFALERETVGGRRGRGRLARFERELHAATAEFAEGLAAIAGPIPALDEAVAAMQSASSSLDAKDLTSARPHEEAALKGLIGARQNLRKILKQSSSSQASACRKFDLQQVAEDSAGRPRDQTKKQLAALENDLRELAKREQKFSEEIEAKGGGGPSSTRPKKRKERSKESQKPASKSPLKGSKSSPSSGATANQNSPAETDPAEAAEAGRRRRPSGSASSRRRTRL